MTLPTKNRIESLDLLKGLVMVIMALDHSRDFFHSSVHFYDPTNPVYTSLPIFFTRWITHYCAPAFSFLAGISAFLVGRRKSKGELSAFLFTRGLWLVFIEITVVTFAWFFDFHYRNGELNVIWALGMSMIVLSALVHLPRKYILIFSCVLIFGHNLLDNVHFNGGILWSMVHEYRMFKISEYFTLEVGYPIVPWIAVMSLGYCFGSFYDKSFDSKKRNKLLNIIGFSAIALFVIVRGINIYGDPVRWIQFGTTLKTIMSFLNPTKYPPSLSYLLMTLGITFVFLANSENLKGRVVNFFSIFGRVPFFFYILHLYLIHFIAMICAQLTGFGWQKMMLHYWVAEDPLLKGYGFRLWVVYLFWIGIIALLYPICKKFDNYKQNHKEKQWLSYL
jgi:uncharacterized membrane protein